MSLSLAGSLRSASSVPAGRAANAASVGAKTVKGPAPLSVSTSPAAVAACSSVLKLPAAVAVWTMSPAGAALAATLGAAVGMALGTAVDMALGAVVAVAVGVVVAVDEQAPTNRATAVRERRMV